MSLIRVDIPLDDKQDDALDSYVRWLKIYLNMKELSRFDAIRWIVRQELKDWAGC